MIQGLQILAIAIAVSLDGFWSGFAMGLRQRRLQGLRLWLAAGISLPCTALALWLARQLSAVISFDAAKWIGAGLLFLLAIYAFVGALRGAEPNPEGGARDLSIRVCAMLGLAVAADASVAAFSMGFWVRHAVLVPPIFALTHAVTLSLGNRLAFLARARVGLLTRFPAVRFAPALIFVVLGGLRVL